MHYIDFKLDEAYPFRVFHDKYCPISKGLRLEIPVSGKAVIAIEDRQNWWLDGLTIAAGNGKLGKDEERFDEELEEGHPIFEAVKEYLYRVVREDVEAAIEAYAVDLAEQRDAYAGY